MKKIIWLLVVTSIFIGIGFTVKSYVEGPSQPVNGIMVSGTNENISAVKNLYKGQTEQTADYQYKLITETKTVESTDEEKEAAKKEWKEKDPNSNMTEEEMDKEINKPTVIKTQYAVITKSTAEKFLKKGILRAPDSEGTLISSPLNEIKELSSNNNLYFRHSADATEISDGKLNLKGQMIPVQHIKKSHWIGYFSSPLVIVTDETYKQLQGKELNLSLIQFSKENFDYKNKNKLNTVVENISKVYDVKEEDGAYDEDKLYFVEVQN